MYQVVYYETARGEECVREFLHELDTKTQAKVYAMLTLLEERGPDLKRPYADGVEGKIRELRIHFSRVQVRVLYFFFHKNEVVLLHGFKKKESSIRPKEIAVAKQRMDDWIKRHGE